MPMPKMEYAGLPVYQDIIPFRGIPAPVQSLEARPGTLEATLFWTAPQTMEGVDGWRVYKDDENNMIFETKDYSLRQLVVKLAGGGSAAFFVCPVSYLGREGPKIRVVASSNSDLVVTTGTTGGTSGTPSRPDPEWQTRLRGGRSTL